MKPRTLGRGVCAAILVWSVANTNCFLQSSSCTAIGCSNRATLTLRTANDVWTAGTYTLDLNVDAMPAQCTLLVADSSSGTVPGNCSSGIRLELAPEASCPPTTCNAGVCSSSSCTPIPGQFHQTLTFDGTPTQVAITVSRDGRQLVQSSMKLNYIASEPNGPGCGICHQASPQLTVPAA